MKRFEYKARDSKTGKMVKGAIQAENERTAGKLLIEQGFTPEKIVEEDDFRTKWKTEKCHNLETYGHCKFGENCAFAHGDDELKEKIKNYNYKSKPCEQFFEKGFCSYGRRCQFSHKIKNTDIYYNFDSRLIIDNKNYINYSQILSKLLLNRQIFLKVVKKPRLMIFKKIANISQKEIEENRLKLYLDIIDLNDNIQKI